MTEPFVIAGRPVGPDNTPYVVAELSANHNGTLAGALALVEAAKRAGADAVKLQTYTADTMTIDHDGEGFVIGSGLWKGRKLYDLYAEAHTPWGWHTEIFARARELGIACFSTPFDETAVDFLESHNTPAYKIASFELVDLPLIARVARTNKPTIISTGMASRAEISEAVQTFRSNGSGPLILLHCISAYPSPPDQANLRRMPMLGAEHGCTYGLSDHTMGDETGIAAVALGASLIEKHLTLNRNDGGPDAGFSLEPPEFARLCACIRTAHLALGTGEMARAEAEADSRILRRSLYAIADIVKGEPLTPANVRAIRPGLGLAPRELPRVIGRTAARTISRGTPLDWSLIH